MNSSTQPISLKDAKGLITQLLDNLTGYQAVIWFKALVLFMRKQNPWTVQMLNTWRYFDIGGGSLSFRELVEKTRKMGYYLSPELISIKMELKTSYKRKQVPFSIRSMEEVGFIGKTYREWLNYVSEHPVFGLCAYEDAFYVRWVYFEEIGNMGVLELNVAMSPILKKHLFSLKGDGKAFGMSCIEHIYQNGIDAEISENDRNRDWLVRIRI